MKHTIRQYGQLTQIDCELGSDIRDKHGKEIIEGDRVRALTPDGDYDIGQVAWDNGTFIWTEKGSGWSTELNSIALDELEIVGHVGD